MGKTTHLEEDISLPASHLYKKFVNSVLENSLKSRNLYEESQRYLKYVLVREHELLRLCSPKFRKELDTAVNLSYETACKVYGYEPAPEVKKSNNTKKPNLTLVK